MVLGVGVGVGVCVGVAETDAYGTSVGAVDPAPDVFEQAASSVAITMIGVSSFTDATMP